MDNRSRAVTRQLLKDLRAYLDEDDETVRFGDLMIEFPSVHPTTLVFALAELEKTSGISFVIRDRALFIEKGDPKPKARRADL